MSRLTQHVRILALPFADSFQSAKLETLREERYGERRDFVVDYGELHLSNPATLVECDGRPYEHIQGYYLPRRLHCIEVSGLERTGLYNRLEEVPVDHGARSLRGSLYWRSPSQEARWGWFNGTHEPADLVLSARQFILEDRPGEREWVDFKRDWSPAPALPARLVPDPKKLHQRFGGDPISFRLEGRVYHRRLFVGGLDCQHDRRPDVGAVLNLGDEASLWCALEEAYPPTAGCVKARGAAGWT